MNVLGTPKEDEVRAMSPSVKATLPEINGCGLKRKLKDVDPLFIDLISKLLVYKPKERLKPIEALLHPYFDDLRAQRLTINSRPVIDLFDFGTVEIGENTDLLDRKSVV